MFRSLIKEGAKIVVTVVIQEAVRDAYKSGKTRFFPSQTASHGELSNASVPEEKQTSTSSPNPK